MAGYGFVVANVFTSRGEIPISNALVTIEMADMSSVLGARITDENGRITPVRIFTPAKSESLNPGYETPFTNVNIRISHPDFYTYFVRDAQVFEGQTSVQVAELIPVAENDTPPLRLEEFYVTPQNL